MKHFSDTKPTADIEYLSSAIVSQALANKFKELFGRDPVAVNREEPMKVEDTRVPNMISESVDADIAKLLKASAIESSKNAAGTVPELSNGTLLYTILEDSPAQIPLDSVEEYQDMEDKDATIMTVSEQDDINVEQGVAYLSKDLSSIEIGIFVANELFAQEFQYRIKSAGGTQLSSEEKVLVFDELIEDLPGGEDLWEEGLRDQLLGAVGLTSEQTPTSKEIPEALKAPGPVAETKPSPIEAPPAVPAKPQASKQASKQGYSLKEIVADKISIHGFKWATIMSSIQKEFYVNNENMNVVKKIYLSASNEFAEKQESIMCADHRIISQGSIVVSTAHKNQRVFSVETIFGDKKDPDIQIKNCATGKIEIVNSKDLLIY